MSNKDVVQNAFAVAMKAHHGQERKYSGQQYIIHPIHVADLVRTVTDDKAMISAALLHDVLEDTPVKIYTLRETFGNEITDLVIELTDVYIHPHQGNRAKRKALERGRLRNISAKAQTIKVADIIDNTADITARDPDFSKVYLAEIFALLPGLDKADSVMRQKAMDQILDLLFTAEG